MTFILANFDAITGGVSANVNDWFSYKNSSDPISTITASAYFNDRITAMEVGDVIHIQGSDDHVLVRVTSVTTNVTVEAYVDTPSILDSAVTQVKIVPNSLDATVCASGTNTNEFGIIPILYRLDTAGGIGSVTDIILTFKTMISRIWVINDGGGNTDDTVVVQNNLDNITDVMPVDKLLGTITRPIWFNNSYRSIDAGQLLRAVTVKGGVPALPGLTVYVYGWREA